MVIQGVIRPPPEIRAVADRTALYVAKNGRAFEARILKSAKGKTPKFAFLQETSPFHAYYEDRIQFYENGGEDSKEEDDTKEKNKSVDEKKDTEKSKSRGRCYHKSFDSQKERKTQQHWKWVVVGGGQEQRGNRAICCCADHKQCSRARDDRRVDGDCGGGQPRRRIIIAAPRTSRSVVARQRFFRLVVVRRRPAPQTSKTAGE